MTGTTHVRMTLVVLLMTAGSIRPGAAQTRSDPASCDPVRPANVLSVVGPMLGRHPAWLVDGSAPWPGPTSPYKTLWVFAQSNQRIEVTGRLRNGAETAGFSRGPGPITESLIVENPRLESAIPGGATADVLRNYAFIPSHVFYPVAGCWEFTVRVAGATHKLVRNVEARQ